MLVYKDKRAKATEEYFNGIRIIKYYAWENMVKDKIFNIRKDENRIIVKTAIFRGVVDVLTNTTPLLVAVAIFGLYVFLKGEEKLTPSKAYAVLSIFNLLIIPLRMIVFAYL